MNYEKIVTLYDTAEHAEAAKRSLESAGFAPSEISLINSKTLGVAGDKLNEPGLWHRLFGRDIKEYEATVYGRSVAAGGVVLTIRLPEAEASRAMSILNAHRAVDLSKRAEQEGLIGTTAAAVASKPATVQTAAVATTPTTVVAGAAMAGRLDAQMRSRTIWLKRRMGDMAFTSMG